MIMAVVIRLARHGRRNLPMYRVVATDKRDPRDGKHLEILGTFNPSDDKGGIRLKKERIEHWIQKGAVPSETVARLLKTVAL